MCACMCVSSCTCACVLLCVYVYLLGWAPWGSAWVPRAPIPGSAEKIPRDSKTENRVFVNLVFPAALENRKGGQQTLGFGALCQSAEKGCSRPTNTRFRPWGCGAGQQTPVFDPKCLLSPYLFVGTSGPGIPIGPLAPSLSHWIWIPIVAFPIFFPSLPT